MIPEGLSAGRSTAVRSGRGGARPLRARRGHPELLDVELVVTQAVCEVCAVSFEDVCAVAERLPTQPRSDLARSGSLGEVLADLPRLGAAANAPAAGTHAAEQAGERIAAVEAAVAGAPRARVAALNGFDPIYVGGHWVPQMIELAGGEDVLGRPGERSRPGDWEVRRPPPRSWSRCPAACMRSRQRQRPCGTLRASLRSARG